MRLLRQRRPPHGAARPAERYLAAGAEEARRLGHAYVGTEHALLALARDADGGSAAALRRLGVTYADIRRTDCIVALWAPAIDPAALATLGIDLDVVRERLERTFGPDALERTQAGAPSGGGSVGAVCIAPRLKQSLQNAVGLAGDQPLRDEHVLLGMLTVRDSLAARALGELGVSLEDAEAVVA